MFDPDSIFQQILNLARNYQAGHFAVQRALAPLFVLDDEADASVAETRDVLIADFYAEAQASIDATSLDWPTVEHAIYNVYLTLPDGHDWDFGRGTGTNGLTAVDSSSPDVPGAVASIDALAANGDLPAVLTPQQKAAATRARNKANA